MSSKTYPSLNLEHRLWVEGSRFVIGVDEVGRGAIAGPVAVGVALLTESRAKFKPLGRRSFATRN